MWYLFSLFPPIPLTIYDDGRKIRRGERFHVALPFRMQTQNSEKQKEVVGLIPNLVQSIF